MMQPTTSPPHLLILDDLACEIGVCRVCPTMPAERRRVAGCGVARPVVLLVGEAPGRFGADRTGVPFSGDRSGAFLRELMEEAGLSTERNAFITNVVKCNPRDERGNNRKPSFVERGACRGYLGREIEILQPWVIATLGDLACREVLGMAIRECVGEPRWWNQRWVLPLYHPSYAASYSYPRERYREQFLRVRELVGTRRMTNDQRPTTNEEGGRRVIRQPSYPRTDGTDGTDRKDDG